MSISTEIFESEGFLNRRSYLRQGELGFHILTFLTSPDSYRDYLTFTKRASRSFFFLERGVHPLQLPLLLSEGTNFESINTGSKLGCFFELDFPTHPQSPTVIVGNIVNAIFEEFNQLTIFLRLVWVF
jgi:hypothetical protein